MKAAGAAPPDGRAGEEAPMWLGRMGMSRLAVRVPEACGALLCGGAAGDPSRCHSPATFPLGPGDGNGEEARTDLDAAPVEKPSPQLPLKSSPDGAGRDGEASTVAYSDRDSAVESSSLDEGGPAAAAPGIGASGPVSPLDWGYPGHLTEAEAEALEGLRAVICPPPGGSVPARSDLREAVFSFGEQEDEDHALCRWLRARRFVLADVLAMIEGAAEERRGPASRDFYPDAAADALGVDEGIYRTQYPQCYPGTFSRPCPQLRSPCPLIFNQPGRLNWSGVRCVAQLSGVHRYQWHCYQHALGDVLRERSRTHPATFIRYQVVAVLDLDGLSRSAVNACVLDLVREQSRVESLCYPEMLGICLVLNAPTFFGAVWAMVRRWIDQRTAAKMEIYCRRAAGHRRLRELVDDADLPSDYGGSGPSVAEIILRTSSRLGGGGGGPAPPGQKAHQALERTHPEALQGGAGRGGGPRCPSLHPLGRRGALPRRGRGRRGRLRTAGRGAVPRGPDGGGRSPLPRRRGPLRAGAGDGTGPSRGGEGQQRERPLPARLRRDARGSKWVGGCPSHLGWHVGS